MARVYVDWTSWAIQGLQQRKYLAEQINLKVNESACNDASVERKERLGRDCIVLLTAQFNHV